MIVFSTIHTYENCLILLYFASIINNMIIIVAENHVIVS
jgi:hypothetical protein